jgi:para-nitrobenzyl esterase
MHVFDVPFAFRNIDAARQIFGPEVDPRSIELQANMSKAWAAFARTGDPSHAGLPDWSPYSVERREAMIFDHSCRLERDPARDLRLAFEPLRMSRLAVRRTANA